MLFTFFLMLQFDFHVFPRLCGSTSPSSSLLQHHHTHLSVPCAPPLVLSFPVLGGGASLGTVAALLPTARPAGQRRGRLAEGPLPAGQLGLGGPLKACQGWGRHRLLLLLRGPLGPSRRRRRTSQTDRRIDGQTAGQTGGRAPTLCCCSCDGTWTCPPTCISCSPAWPSLRRSEGKKRKGKVQDQRLKDFYGGHALLEGEMFQEHAAVSRCAKGVPPQPSHTER